MDKTTMRVLTQAAETSALLDKSAVREAIKQLSVSQKLSLTSADRKRLAELPAVKSLAAQVQETFARTDLSKTLGAQMRETLLQSELHAKLTADMRLRLADLASQPPSWDSVIQTADVLAPAERTDLEEIYDTATNELHELGNEAGEASSSLSPISLAAALVYARIAVAATMVMLLNWTDFEISQESQSILDLALEMLGLVPARDRSDEPE